MECCLYSSGKCRRRSVNWGRSQTLTNWNKLYALSASRCSILNPVYIIYLCEYLNSYWFGIIIDICLWYLVLLGRSDGDKKQRLPIGIHLPSTCLGSRACHHEAIFSKSLAWVFFCCLFMFRNGLKNLKNLGRCFHEWKMVWKMSVIWLGKWL